MLQSIAFEIGLGEIASPKGIDVRPQYHYTPAANWLSDPNGLVHDGELWHMFYQYNPHGEDWGHMSWGHAVSPDLARWQELPPALLDDDRRMVFSGSAVMDRTGSAGFGNGAMIALYTAAMAGKTQRQAQALAWSNDQGRNWTEFSDNPVIDLGLADFRDPFVFRHEASESWIMVVVKSNEQMAQIYRSDDLKAWHLSSEFGAGGAPGLVWECPTLVELPICGTGHTRWLFKVDALRGAPGAGALYWTGDFDGYRFKADGSGWHTLDQGRDFYAAIAWNGPRDKAGRPAWIGWMGNHAYQKNFPKRGWRGVMSAPRRMGLADRPDGLRLAQQVELAVGGLFGDFSSLGSFEDVPVASRIELDREFAGTLSLSDGAGSRFTVRADGGRWRLERRDAKLPFLDAEAELERGDGEGLSIWLDSETIEVFTPDGTSCAGFQHRPMASRLRIETGDAHRVSVAELA